MARKIKQVYFNITRDKELLEIAEGIENFSDWVKKCLKTEISQTDIEELVSRMIAERMIGQVVPSAQQLAKRAEPKSEFSFDGYL